MVRWFPSTVAVLRIFSGVLTDLSAAWFALVFVAPVAGAPAGDALKRVGLGLLFLLLAAKFEEVNE